MLNEAKARLREVEEGIASLQAKYEECVAKKQELGDKCDLCTARLERAEKVEYGKPCMHIYMTRSGIIIHIRTQKLEFCVVITFTLALLTRKNYPRKSYKQNFQTEIMSFSTEDIDNWV